MIVFSLCKVTTLYLSSNCLVSLPDDFASGFPSLQTLALNQNEFKSFPFVVLQMITLQSLNLQDNPIAALPTGIASLTNLKQLFLSNCSLSALPVSLGALTQLTQLHLARNKFVSLPSSLGAFANLQTLLLDNNRLKSIPASLMLCSSLLVRDMYLQHFDYNNYYYYFCYIFIYFFEKYLSMNNNEISSLPTSIWKLGNMWHLDVSNNMLSVLPKLGDKVRTEIWVKILIFLKIDFQKTGDEPSLPWEYCSFERGH